jgi:hypothetical protein
MRVWSRIPPHEREKPKRLIAARTSVIVRLEPNRKWAKRWATLAEFENNLTITKESGGEGGIRTLGARKGTPHFECGTIDHSATSPQKTFPGLERHSRSVEGAPLTGSFSGGKRRPACAARKVA